LWETNLVEEGHDLLTDADAQKLRAYFSRWGQDFLNYARGDFFGLWFCGG
jgi:asparagine synthetase B (glutamine-hydrolysing)